MTDNKTTGEPTGKRSWRNFGITVAVIAVALVVMIMASPRGFETDLGKIGKGTPALVLVYDPNLVVSGEQVHELNQIRDEFEADVHFLLADVGYEQARTFIDNHRTHPGVMLFFSAQGELLTRLQAPMSAPVLREQLQALLN